MSAEREREPKFGERMRGIYASVKNPQRDGFYVETIRRTGKMNAGKGYRLTDGHGDFWEYPAESTILRGSTPAESPRFLRTIVCSACAMEDDEPLRCDSPDCDGQPRFVTAEQVVTPAESTEALSEIERYADWKRLTAYVEAQGYSLVPTQTFTSTGNVAAPVTTEGESVHVVVPARFWTDISEGLVELTKMCHLAGHDISAGLLGGEFGYGARVDNDVFMMHPFCWCDKDDCPWCESDAPNFHHKASGFEVRWYKYIGRSQEQLIPDGVNWTDVLNECIASLAPTESAPETEVDDD